MRKPTRHFSPENKQLLLGHLKRCRFACTAALGATDTNEALRSPLGKLLRDLDSLAALIAENPVDAAEQSHWRSLLDTIAAMRQACVSASGCVQPFGDLYRAIDVVMSDIDEIAGHLTGDATYFHIKILSGAVKSAVSQ